MFLWKKSKIDYVFMSLNATIKLVEWKPSSSTFLTPNFLTCRMGIITKPLYQKQTTERVHRWMKLKWITSSKWRRSQKFPVAWTAEIGNGQDQWQMRYQCISSPPHHQIHSFLHYSISNQEGGQRSWEKLEDDGWNLETYNI